MKVINVTAGGVALDTSTALVADARRVVRAQAFLDSSTQSFTALHWPSVAFLRGASKLTASGIPRTFGLARLASESAVLLDMRGGVETPSTPAARPRRWSRWGSCTRRR